MHSKKDYIGVFDSGLGGISVLRELVKAMPQERVRIFGFFWRDVERQTTTNGAYLHIDAEFFIINSVY